MATLKLANNATTVLAVQISDTSTAIEVDPGTGARFPELVGDEYFKVTLQDRSNNYEIVKVIARVDDTMTIIRAQSGTTAMPFPANSRVELRVLADNISEYVDQFDFLLL